LIGITVMLVAAIAGLVAGWLRWRFIVVDVVGVSMEPTLHYGDRVLVRRARLSALRERDLVVVDLPKPEAPRGARTSRWRPAPTWMVKRAAGLPGNRVPAGLITALGMRSGSTVPAGWFAVLGDNHDYSYDSRTYGLLPARRLIGVVVRRIPTAATPHGHRA
jgi:signal peptidase I